MLDGVARKIIDPALNAIAQRASAWNISPNAVTISGFVLGIAAAAMIAWSVSPAATVLVLVLSRLADGLDGAIARAGARASDTGGYLDIVLDFAFYGAVPLAFAMQQPQVNALPAAVLLFSFYVNGASFLAFAAIAARREEDAAPRGRKALVFSVGLAEATETIAVFAAMVFWPHLFPVLAWAFAALCLLTAAQRMAMAVKTFR